MKSVLVFVVIITFLTSCKQKEDAETNINNYANAVLVASQNSTSSRISSIINSLHDKLNKSETRDSALVYMPKADSSVAIGNKMANYLDNLINKINNNETLSSSDSLFEKLKAFEEDVMKIDPKFNQDFGDTILYIDTIKSFKDMDSHQFYNQFLYGNSKNAFIIFLNSLKENILIVESEIVHYCDVNIGGCIYRYERYTSFISQNSKYFKPNDELEITAGIGAFSSMAKPEFIINKKKLELEPDGAARYKMQVSNEKGKHIVPIRVSFIKPNGLHEVETKYVIYYVE